MGSDEARGATSVPVLALSDYFARQRLTQLDVLKIDVQGFEWQVLEGAGDLFERYQPTLIMELDNRELSENWSEVLPRFSRFGMGNHQVRRVGELQCKPLAGMPEMAKADLARGRLQTNFVFVSPSRKLLRTI